MRETARVCGTAEQELVRKGDEVFAAAKTGERAFLDIEVASGLPALPQRIMNQPEFRRRQQPDHQGVDAAAIGRIDPAKRVAKLDRIDVSAKDDQKGVGDEARGVGDLEHGRRILAHSS